MPALKWTEEKLMADALKYKTRNEWYRESGGAYVTARKRGLLDVCCGHMTAAYTYWSTDALKADALKYKTRGEWRRESRGAYKAAFNRGLLDVCCGHMPAVLTYWSTDTLKADALKYKTRNEWYRESNRAYQTALKRGLLDVCCGHMERGRFLWTDDNLIADALKYKTRSEWKSDSEGAYATACKRGLLDACCGHMDRGFSSTDNDAVYIWKAIGQSYNGNQVYKIGVTSARLGEIRVLRCANKAEFDAEIVILANVDGKATEVEKSLLTIGADPKYVGFDGCTEFRAMTATQLNRAIDIINSNIKQQLLAA
jgi:hypothetical protein